MNLVSYTLLLSMIQKLVNQGDEFPTTFRHPHHSSKLARENVLLHIQKIIQRRKLNFIKNRCMKFHKIRVICSPSYSPVLPLFPRVPTRIVGQMTFNTQTQRYEFVDSAGTKIDLSYVIYHGNHNKCSIILTVVNWSHHPSPLFL